MFTQRSNVAVQSTSQFAVVTEIPKNVGMGCCHRKHQEFNCTQVDFLTTIPKALDRLLMAEQQYQNECQQNEIQVYNKEFESNNKYVLGSSEAFLYDLLFCSKNSKRTYEQKITIHFFDGEITLRSRRSHVKYVD